MTNREEGFCVVAACISDGSLLRCVGSHVTLPKSQNNLELVARLPVTNQTLILIFLTFIFSMAAGIHPVMIRISFILSSLKA